MRAEDFSDVTVHSDQSIIFIKTETKVSENWYFSQSGFESDKHKVFIICDAEKMHVNAANSLLQEEVELKRATKN